MVRGASVCPMKMLAATLSGFGAAGAHHPLHQLDHGAHENLHDAQVIEDPNNDAIKIMIGSTWNANTMPNWVARRTHACRQRRTCSPSALYPSMVHALADAPRNTSPKLVFRTRKAKAELKPRPHSRSRVDWMLTAIVGKQIRDGDNYYKAQEPGEALHWTDQPTTSRISARLFWRVEEMREHVSTSCAAFPPTGFLTV